MSQALPRVTRHFTPQAAAMSFLKVGSSSDYAGGKVNPQNIGVHNEIDKVILPVLSPKVPENSKWIPPSREYMNKAGIFQICLGTITDVENVLLCDACEEGYHLSCLQSFNQIIIPKAERPCQKCLALSHGKTVYESHHDTILLANSIKGQCEVQSCTRKILKDEAIGMWKPTIHMCLSVPMQV